jgi:hypothetical protein
MPRGPNVSDIVEQVKERLLKQIEEQFTQHERLSVELERLRDVMVELERAVVSRLGGGQPPAAKPTEPAERSRAAKGTKAPVRTPRGQNKAKILETLKGRVPMTASEIAKAKSIPRATVSTTLTKMAKTGELAKPNAATPSRGSQLAAASFLDAPRPSLASRERRWLGRGSP